MQQQLNQSYLNSLQFWRQKKMLLDATANAFKTEISSSSKMCKKFNLFTARISF